MVHDNKGHATGDAARRQKEELPELPLNEFDPGSKSLAEALRISFKLLKVIMALLVVMFILSGLFTVGPDENALVLRFGKIRGSATEAVLGPGIHWVMPHPIDEVVRIPVRKVQSLAIDDFWYYETDREKATGQSMTRPTDPLIPQRDGYVLTRNDSVEGLDTAYDYSILHSKWRLTYRISDPLSFFRNIYMAPTQPGQDFYDVAGETIEPLLRAIATDAIVTTMVSYSIDEALVRTDGIAIRVREHMTRKLSEIGSGITVDTMQLATVRWPRQVEQAFQDSIGARQESETLINQARGYAETTLNEAGGPISNRLHDALMAGASEEELEPLWGQLAGESQRLISTAKAYRTEVVEKASANAIYLQRMLPEYRLRPVLVVQEIYRDAIEEVMQNANEKIIADSSGKGEIRIMINSNPVKEKKEGER